MLTFNRGHKPFNTRIKETGNSDPDNQVEKNEKTGKESKMKARYPGQKKTTVPKKTPNRPHSPNGS